MFNKLGELQVSYQQFVVTLQQFDDYFVNGYYFQRKENLTKGLSNLRTIYNGLERQLKLAEQDLALTSEASKATESLFADKVLSMQDLRDQKSRLLGKEVSIPQLESVLLENINQQIDKQKEVDDLNHSAAQQKAIFIQSLQTIKSLVDGWKMKFIISSPVSGKVVFINPIQVNQYLAGEKLLGYVNPPDSRYSALFTLPQANFGKIERGQVVLLRFDAYPFQEFGYVPAKLSYISAIPSDSGFLATAELPGGLVTNYHKTIQYKSGLRSQALIITRNIRLFQRFLYAITGKVHSRV